MRDIKIALEAFRLNFRFSSKILWPIFIFIGSLLEHRAVAATISFVGKEEGSGTNGPVQYWSNPGVAKAYDLGGSEKYGTAGYYEIRPMATNAGSANIYTGVTAGNNLGISAGSNPTLYSKPVILNSITGGAGDYVNFNGYPLFRGPDGSTFYRLGGLSVPVSTGAYGTPGGNGYYGEAFNFTTALATTFRVGVAVDTVASGTYAPNYVGIYNNSSGTVFSTALTRDGTPDMAVFEIDAAAGESFTAAMWQLSGTQSAAAYSLVTFDVSKYNFNVASGSQTNSTVLNGAPAALVKTGNGTLVVTSSNSYGGGTTISAGTLKLQGGSVAGSITNNGNLTLLADLANSVSGTGSLTKLDAGNATLWSANTYTGATVVEAGQLRLDGSGAISSNSVVQVAAGAGFSATGVFKTSNDLTIAGLTGAGTFYNARGKLTVNKSSSSDTFSGLISGGTDFHKTGAGHLVLSGNNTYTGATAVNAGVLEVASGGSIGTSSATVNSGGTLDVDGTAGSVTVNSGGTLKGSGTVGALAIASGGTLAVGNSPGTLTASSATWNGGGTYAWEINNFLGSQGTSWDFLNINGGLTINASSGSKFVIDVISLLAPNNTGGAASNFDAFSNYSFAIATAAGGVSGFDASYFNILTSNFSNNVNPVGATASGSWYLTQSGNSINLNYAAATAIPEPSTGILLLLGLAAVFRRRTSKR